MLDELRRMGDCHVEQLLQIEVLVLKEAFLGLIFHVMNIQWMSNSLRNCSKGKDNFRVTWQRESLWRIDTGTTILLLVTQPHHSLT